VVARALKRPPQVREAVAAALEEWIATADHPDSQVREPHLDWLRALLAAWPDRGATLKIVAAGQGKDPGQRLAALEKLAAEADVRQLPPETLRHLAACLRAARSTSKALHLLRRARQQYPADFWLNLYLGASLRETEPPQGAEAVRYLTVAVALRPNSPGVYLNLGAALRDGRQLDEAIACYEQALALAPKYAPAHYNLGLALAEKGEVDEAIARYRQAIAFDPKHAWAHNNLGNALQRKGKGDEALALYRQALALDPRHVEAHNNLGSVLQAKGRLDEAITSFRRAIAIDPRFASAHFNLGLVLGRLNQLAEAIASYRQAVAIDPRFREAHIKLGGALSAQGKLGEASSHFRKAVELQPGDGNAHYNLGAVLLGLREWDEAVACFRKAIELAPAFAEAHCNLGHALQGRGDFAEALVSLQRGHELGGQRDNWKYPSAQWVRSCEQLIEREKQLLGVLAGKSEPADAQERLEWARLCVQTRRYASAARLSGEAFAAETELADDLKAGHRWQAAAVAALAAAGQGRDAGGLADGQKVGLRKLALGWLKADLAARARQPAGERAAVLRRWQADERLAGVRAEQALQALPRAERAAWVDFWSAVQKDLLDEGGP